MMTNTNQSIRTLSALKLMGSRVVEQPTTLIKKATQQQSPHMRGGT